MFVLQLCKCETVGAGVCSKADDKGGDGSAAVDIPGVVALPSCVTGAANGGAPSHHADGDAGNDDDDVESDKEGSRNNVVAAFWRWRPYMSRWACQLTTVADADDG